MRPKESSTTPHTDRKTANSKTRKNKKTKHPKQRGAQRGFSPLGRGRYGKERRGDKRVVVFRRSRGCPGGRRRVDLGG